MQLTVTYDPSKDAENHIRAIVDEAYAAHGRVRMKETLLAAVESDAVRTAIIAGGERNAILKNVTALLANAPNRAFLDDNARQLEHAWEERGSQVVLQLEALYDHDWPFDAVHVDLTTLSICPYDFKARRISIHYLPDVQSQLRILSHELNHFLFYFVYAKELFEKLGQEKFGLLKESITLFTNPEQAGKPNEKPLRELYIAKHVRSIDEAVRVGAAYLMDTP